MSPAMQDSVGQLGAFVNATTPKPPPPAPYPGYDAVFQKHYPRFYKSLTSGYEKDKGYVYLNKDTPQLFGSLTQDCTRKGAPAFCYGVGHAGMVDFKDAHKSTSFIFSGA